MALSENYQTKTIGLSDCRPIVRLSADTIVRWDYRPNPSMNIMRLSVEGNWAMSKDQSMLLLTQSGELLKLTTVKSDNTHTHTHTHRQTDRQTETDKAVARVLLSFKRPSLVREALSPQNCNSADYQQFSPGSRVTPNAYFTRVLSRMS